MISLLVWFITAIHAGLLLIYVANLFYLRRSGRQAGAVERPFVSILIPARNEESNLSRLLPSLLYQRYPSFEVIVYDDDSDDRTWEILSACTDRRLRAIKGDGPQPGWAGKVHALYQASRHAAGSCYLFLDADTELADPDALSRLVDRYLGMPEHSVLTGMPRYQGRGLLLVSLVPSAILTAIPWPLVRLLPVASLGALNGQCWMIDAGLYRTHEPHEAVAAEILEDVQIGRYLKARGIIPTLVDVQEEINVFMYDSLPDAWRGFRKNAYLLSGDHPLSFLFVFSMFLLIFVVAPLLSVWLLALVFLNKFVTDRRSRFPLWISLCAPLSFLLGSTLQLDSAWHHLTGRVSWKGRSF